jgi:hypothetical protein
VCLLDEATRQELESALADSEFDCDAQLTLPFAMVRDEAELDFRARVALLKDKVFAIA